MKILVVTGRFGSTYAGGIERVSFEVTKRLAKKHDVLVIAQKRLRDENTTTDIPIITSKSFNIPKTNFWVFYYQYKKKQLVKNEIKNFKPDIIYAHNPYDTYASLGLGVPVVSHIHSLYTEYFLSQESSQTILPRFYWDWFWKYRLELEKKILSQSDLIITYSEYLADLIKSRGGNKIKIIPNGIDTKAFTNKGEKSNLLKKPNVVFTGRIEKIKGIESLIHAAIKLPEINFYLIGEKIDNYDFPKNMILLGKKNPNKIPEFLRSADIFINPVLRDGFEIANIEAMACGIPVITTEGFERSQIYKDVAVLIPPDNSSSIISSIKKIFSETSFRNDLIERGIKFAVKYNWDEISLKIENELISVNSGNLK